MNKYNFQVGDFCISQNVLCEITSVGSKTISCYPVYDAWQYHEVLICEPKPIPITEEWLELNHIHLEKITQHSDDIDFRFWYSEDHRLEISNLSNTIYNGYSAEVRMYRAHMDNEDYETIGCLDVQYVHQIQHLCRDCQYEFKPKFKNIPYQE